uniref:Major facilitator superfamily (MFS) profile domain-containing protein n=1 Tax=Fagus sylvatica TaxID=28930 RepID=A0A2N9GQL4_FAGSY
MADGVLFKIAEGIIGQLGNTALQEIGLLWGVNDELEKLKNTVTSIQAVLLDAEEKQALNQCNQELVGKAERILPIVGIGGMGKTTLAQLVFNDDKIKNHFEDLHKEIEGKRYFLVLDDVWNDDRAKWLSLKKLLMSGARGIKELPNDITKLVNLRYLELDSCYGLTHMPRGLGKLTNLRELSLFVMSDDSDSVSRHHGKLKELSRLNDLRGELEIKNLRHGKDAALELKDANLKVKQYLQSLSLEWKEEDVNDADVVYDEQSLECLQPHPNLKMLSLSGFQGVRFPIRCPLTRVLRHLTALKSLCISDFDGDEMEWQELNSLSTLGFRNFPKVSLPVGLQHVTSLKSLEIEDCPSLMTIPEWICNLISLPTTLHMELPQFDIISGRYSCPYLSANTNNWKMSHLIAKMQEGNRLAAKANTLESVVAASNCANVETGLYPSKRYSSRYEVGSYNLMMQHIVKEYSVFGSILTAGGIVGALVNGKIADTLWFSEIFCIAGWLAIAIAKLTHCLWGYISSSAQLMICCGFSLMYFIGNVIPRRMLALIGAIPCILELLGLIFIPESPKWLAKVGNEKEFETSLQCLRGWNADISQEAADIRVYSNFIFF